MRKVATTDRHEWTRKRLGALRLGLLDPDETQRCAEHLSECPSCREEADDTTSDEDGAAPWKPLQDEHIPSSLLARWTAAKDLIRGLERLLIRRHLEHCADCRADLELLGHEAVLEVVPSLELDWDPFARTDIEPSASVSPATADRSSALSSDPLLAPLRRVGEAVEQGIQAAKDLLDSTTNAMQALFIPVMELRPVRSAQAINGALDLAADTRAVKISISMPGAFPPDASIAVVIQSPAGDTILHRRIAFREISPPGTLLFVSQDEPFTPGIYSLVIEAAENPDARIEYRFEFRRPKD